MQSKKSPLIIVLALVLVLMAGTAFILLQDSNPADERGTLSGNVVDGSNSAYLKGVKVTAYDQDGQHYTSHENSDTTGDDVARLYYGGRARAVVEYNMFDALTTYLVWLRAEYVSGRFTAQQYADEQCRLRELIEHEAKQPQGAYLQTYLDAWTVPARF